MKRLQVSWLLLMIWEATLKLVWGWKELSQKLLSNNQCAKPWHCCCCVFAVED